MLLVARLRVAGRPKDRLPCFHREPEGVPVAIISPSAFLQGQFEKDRRINANLHDQHEAVACFCPDGSPSRANQSSATFKVQS